MKLVSGYLRECHDPFDNYIFPKSICSIVLCDASHPMVNIENIRITNLFESDHVSAFSLDGIEKGSQPHKWTLRIISK